MKIFFKPSFSGDFKKLPLNIKEEIRHTCFEIFPYLKDLRDFKEYEIKPMKGFRHYYRMKIKEYRLGFKRDNNSVIFMRVKYRKDIYKFFP